MTDIDKLVVRRFRNALPYIHVHRGHTFVVSFAGEAVADAGFPALVHDLALLIGLGIRLVLVHGIRPQVEERLRARGVKVQYQDNRRITDDPALQCVKEAAGSVRIEIEALLSMGLANSPMAGANIRVVSGNFVTAKPLGVRGGVDFRHTGVVRRINHRAIQRLLQQDDVVLLSPLGYSPTGEVFNIRAEEVATAAAIALKADKFLILMEHGGLTDRRGQPIRQLTTAEAEELVLADTHLPQEPARHLRAAVAACQSGVNRVHLLDRKVDGALLFELFTRDGIGTLVSATPFEQIRTATIRDVVGILELIRPLEDSGVLVKRSREHLETAIEDFTVLDREGLVVGCAALHAFPDSPAAELACLAVHPEYRGEKRGERLLKHIENLAGRRALAHLFVLSTQSAHWFREHGFSECSVEKLPSTRQAAYSFHRNPKVLVKKLD